MSLTTRAWEIKKMYDAQPALPSHRYKRVSCLIVHDHTTQRQQRTYLLFRGKGMSNDQIASKATSFCREIGYTLKREQFTFDFLGEGKALNWAAGKAKVRRFARLKPDSQTTNETDSEEQTETPAEQTEDENRSAFFPDPGNGVLIVMRPGRKQWLMNVWAYGEEKVEVSNIASSYSTIIAGDDPEAARVVDSSRGALMGIAALGVCGLAWLLGASAVIQPSVAYAAIYGSLAVAAAGVWMWWRSPITRLWGAGNMPAAVSREAKPLRTPRHEKAAVRGGAFSTALSKDLALCIDVPMDTTILPDMGGVSIGTDSAGRRVRIPDMDRYKNITVVGAPGTGKTTLMMTIAGGDMMRIAEGAEHTIIWLETKKDGAEKLAAMAEKAGVETLYFVPGSHDGPQLRWLDWTDPEADAGTLTESFVAAFDPSSIQEQSRDVLAALIDMAAMVWPRHLRAIGETKMNLMRTAWLLAGGNGWKPAEDLLDQIKRNTLDEKRYEECREKIGIYFGLSERDRDQRIAPARNKLNRLKNFPAWTLDLRRPVWTWREVLESNRLVIVDISKFDDTSLKGYSEEMIRILLPTALFTLWSEAQFHCSGWYDQNKSVSIYCDEASNLKYSSGKILTEISTQGRSHGVSLVLGAQGWTQLSEVAQIAFRAAGHKLFLASHDIEGAETLAKNFVNSDFNITSLQQLEPFEMIALLRMDGKEYAPVVLGTESEQRWDPEKAWREHEPAMAA